MSSESDKLEKRISSADDAIGRALEERARAYRELHAESAGRLVDTREVAALLKSRAPSLRSESLDALARELESACQAAARPPQIAIAGEAGSIVHRVARGFFGAAATFVTVADTESVFDALARSRCDYGVVPFESTTDGAFVSALVGLTESNARIAGEIWTPAGYQLASVTGNAGDVEKVYSTAAAHAACRSFLRSRFSSASVIEVDSVASGVGRAAD